MVVTGCPFKTAPIKRLIVYTKNWHRPDHHLLAQERRSGTRTLLPRSGGVGACPHHSGQDILDSGLDQRAYLARPPGVRVMGTGAERGVRQRDPMGLPRFQMPTGSCREMSHRL